VATVTPAPPVDERLTRAGPLRRLLLRPEVGSLIGAVVVFMFFTIAASENFPTIGGAARILDPASTLGIMAVAVGLLMIGGEFDLSCGALIGSTGLIVGMLSVNAGLNLWLALALALVFALLVGLFNGYMVVKTGLPSFIVTLGTFFVLRGVNVGVTRLVTEEIRTTGIDEQSGFTLARRIFNTEFGLFGTTWRTSTLWWIALTAVASWTLLRTRFGNRVFAVGGNPQAARSVGVPLVRTKVALFMITAGAAWLVGVMTTLRLRGTVASEGIGQEFVFIVSAVIGGCLLTGGYGSAVGPAIGALIFGMIRVGITFTGWPTDWFYAFLGVMLLLAVLVNTYVRKQAEEVPRA
jgi:simple sugar transport system permease protein